MKISCQDREAIIKYSKTHGNKTIEILDNSYQFDNDTSDYIKDNLISPRFIYNLLNKFGGKKSACCAIVRLIELFRRLIFIQLLLLEKEMI